MSSSPFMNHLLSEMRVRGDSLKRKNPTCIGFVISFVFIIRQAHRISANLKS